MSEGSVFDVDGPGFGYDFAMVAFMDILGWSNLIVQSAENP